MPRPLRKCLPDVTYHCYSRCIELRNLLASDHVKDLAVDSIKMASEKYSFELIQIEFVENHFHFIIRTVKSGETISRIMQYIKSTIARKYNCRFNRTGPFWNERFKSKIIEEAENPEQHFFQLLWYIAYNPVRKRVISDPRESNYGTIRALFDNDFKPKVAISFHKFFLALGHDFQERAKRFLEYEKIFTQKMTASQQFS